MPDLVAPKDDKYLTMSTDGPVLREGEGIAPRPLTFPGPWSGEEGKVWRRGLGMTHFFSLSLFSFFFMRTGTFVKTVRQKSP